MKTALLLKPDKSRLVSNKRCKLERKKDGGNQQSDGTRVVCVG